MAKKAPPIAPPVAAKPPKTLKVKADLPPVVNPVVVTELLGRVAELESDLVRIATLCGKVWGEPLASEAVAIATKRQGVVG